MNPRKSILMYKWFILKAGLTLNSFDVLWPMPYFLLKRMSVLQTADRLLDVKIDWELTTAKVVAEGVWRIEYQAARSH